MDGVDVHDGDSARTRLEAFLWWESVVARDGG